MLPWTWGLSGPKYEEAEARYYLTGEDLDRKLIDLRWHEDTHVRHLKHLEYDLKIGKISAYDFDIRMLEFGGKGTDALARAEVDLKHHKIDSYQFDLITAMQSTKDGPDRVVAMAEVDLKHDKIDMYAFETAVAMARTKEGQEREIALLDIDLKHGKITAKAHEKGVATAKSEPWIGIINDGFDLAQGLNGVFFEFDWNTYWIDYLKLAGYYGPTDEDIVEMWFNDVCRSMAAQSESLDFDEADFSPGSPILRMTQPIRPR